MTQSKRIQRIEIPSKEIKSDKTVLKDKSFDLWEFLSTKSSEGSNCPIRGSLRFARQSPLTFAFSLIGIVVLLLSSNSMHLFQR